MVMHVARKPDLMLDANAAVLCRHAARVVAPCTQAARMKQTKQSGHCDEVRVLRSCNRFVRMRKLDPRFWLVAALSLGPAVANSFARFAYALLLPAMRTELGLNYSQAGSLNTANAFGYLAGALFTVGYVSRLGNRRMFSVGMVVTALALVGSGLVEGFAAQVAMRAMSGFGGAMVFICGAVLASNVFADRPDLSPTAVGIYFGGAGAGILLSGAGIPWLLAIAG